MRRFIAWLSLSALIIVLDQISKVVILKNFQLGDVLPVTEFFDLVLVYNRGAAFSFLSDAEGWQRWFFIVLAAGICAWLVTLLRKHQHETLQPFAFALVIGGALGNVIDRVLYGAVVDFLYFHVGEYGWPAFNVADSAICAGVALMVLAQIREARDSKASGKSTA